MKANWYKAATTSNYISLGCKPFEGAGIGGKGTKEKAFTCGEDEQDRKMVDRLLPGLCKNGSDSAGRGKRLFCVLFLK